MMQNRSSPVKVRIDDSGGPATALGGLVLVLRLLASTGILARLPRDLKPGQGWTDGHMLLALVLMNVAGLDRVSDIDRLERDRGLRRLVRRFEPAILGRRRDSVGRRFRRGRRRCLPSARSIHDWLESFHVAEAESLRVEGAAFIPPLSEGRASFLEVGRRVLAEAAGRGGMETATIDLDATIVASGKRESLHTYRAATGKVPGERGYQPLVAFCREAGMVPHLEMRDGNVPASLDNDRVLHETLLQLPETVERVTVRTDGAGYQESVIRYCNDPDSRPEAARRFGVIGLVCGATLSDALKAEVSRLPEDAWSPVPPPERDGAADAGSGLECAELGFVSEMAARQKRSHVVRYVVTRRPLPGQLGVGHDEIAGAGGEAWKIRAYCTNFPAPDAERGDRASGPAATTPQEIVRLAHDRCGRGEEVHAVLKDDFAGGMMPSGRFGANAAWMAAAAVALNVVALLRRAALGPQWTWRRMKQVRARWLYHVARVVRRCRQTVVVLPGEARHVAEALRRLAPEPPPP